MSKKQKKPHEHASLPTLLTDLQLLEDMELKVSWNLGQYLAAADYGVADARLVAYTSIDYCIAVISYRDWIVTKWINLATYGRPPEVSNGPASVGEEPFKSWLNSNISYLQFCQEIANTAKHGQYADKKTLRDPVAQTRAWLTPVGEAACLGMNSAEKWRYLTINPQERSYDRALYAEGFSGLVKGSEVLHLPYEDLRSFAALHGIR